MRKLRIFWSTWQNATQPNTKLTLTLTSITRRRKVDRGGFARNGAYGEVATKSVCRTATTTIIAPRLSDGWITFGPDEIFLVRIPESRTFFLQTNSYGD